MIRIKKQFFIILFILFLFSFCSCKSYSFNTLVIGDSLFSGFKIPFSKSVFYLIDKKLPGDFINNCEIGLSARNVTDRLKEFDKITITHVIIELGSNDFLRNIDCKITYKNLSNIIKYFKNKNVKVCVVNFYDSSMLDYRQYFTLFNHEFLEEYNNIFLDLENILLINNIWDGKFSNEEYKIDDFHPNKKGSKLISNIIVNFIKKSNFYSS